MSTGAGRSNLGRTGVARSRARQRLARGLACASPLMSVSGRRRGRMRRTDSLPVRTMRKPSLSAPVAVSAKMGLVLVLVVFVVGVFYWTGVVGGGVKAVDTSSPSYLDGSAYANGNFSISTTERAVCGASNAGTTDNLTEWMQGCHDSWAIDVFSSNTTGLHGGVLP